MSALRDCATERHQTTNPENKTVNLEPQTLEVFSSLHGVMILWFKEIEGRQSISFESPREDQGGPGEAQERQGGQGRPRVTKTRPATTEARRKAHREASREAKRDPLKQPKRDLRMHATEAQNGQRDAHKSSALKQN